LKVFSTVDDHLWRLTYRWALRSHPNKSKHWVVARYFGQFNASRQNRWVFGDRDSGAYLRRFDWTKIVRHRMVMGTSSPDDPALTEYWADRRRKGPTPLNTPTLRLLRAQHGRCPACGDLLLLADHEPQSPLEWERWIKTARKALRVKALIAPAAVGPADNSDGFTTQHLLHTHCSRHLAGTIVRGFSRPETPLRLA
jgi:RNA-directed DNA polymerase